MNIDYSQASQEVQSQHFFTREEPMLPGFQRFFSADPRLPFSIAYPEALEPFYHEREYMNILSVTLGKGALGVIRADRTGLPGSTEQNLPASLIPLSSSPQIDQLLETVKNWGYRGASFELDQPWHIEQDVSPVTVGEPAFQAARLRWQANDNTYGEWVIFQSQLNLWIIFRNAKAQFSADDFNIILRSFRFLGEAFFHSLGVRWSHHI